MSIRRINHIEILEMTQGYIGKSEMAENDRKINLPNHTVKMVFTPSFLHNKTDTLATLY